MPGSRSAPFRADRPSVAELAAGAVVRRRSDGRVLLLHERTEARWCFPKGHVDAGETLVEAARREIAEEAGLTDLAFGPEVAEVAYRFFQPDHDRNVFKTNVFLLADTGQETLTLEPFFDDGRWVTLDEAAALVQRPTDRTVVEAARSAARAQR